LSSVSIPEHFFRHEYGRLVSVLSHRLGVRHLEAIEDAVQSALATGLEAWKANPLPENPSAWLYRVAWNRLIGDLRQRARRLAILKRHAQTEFSPVSIDPQAASEDEIADDLLKMLFFCCDTEIPVESRLVLALKTLCGFDVGEIAQRLFTSEENIYKRLSRARNHLKSKNKKTADLTPADYSARLEGVHYILYLLFSEGYLSTLVNFSLRSDLCREAIRLTELLARSSVGAVPETAALLAMMYFHLARSSGRVDGSGGLVLLEDQDRTLWDGKLIRAGMGWLELSARGDRYSRYHAEAAIAAEHCLAPSFSETNWEKILRQYDLLLSSEPTAVLELNRAVAIAEAKGPAVALEILQSLSPPAHLSTSYLWFAVLADLNFRNGTPSLGSTYATLADRNAPSLAIKELLGKRFETYTRAPAR
jgi:RNA polymerase sigma-70 factor (ECF subfamily)